MEMSGHSQTVSVLLLDDEREGAERTRRILEEAGFAVTSAVNSKTALRLIERERPQLVITQLSPPDRTGIDMLEAVRAANPGTPVIVIAEGGELADARDAVRQGAFHYIQKPWAVEDLLVICRRAVETIALRDENTRLRRITSDLTLGISERVCFSLRPERAAMERAALVRVSQLVGGAITKASTRVLEQALGEQASDEVLADVLGEALVKDATGGEWAAALLRGAQVQRDLLQQAGGSLSASQAGSLLGISRAAVDKRRRQRALLGLKLPSGDFVYPAAQFARHDVLPGLSGVLAAFHVGDPWMQLDALLARDEALDGRTAFEALAEGHVERVKARVSGFGEQGL